jgi:hypothetical protein
MVSHSTASPTAIAVLKTLLLWKNTVLPLMSRRTNPYLSCIFSMIPDWLVAKSTGMKMLLRVAVELAVSRIFLSPPTARGTLIPSSGREFCDTWEWRHFSPHLHRPDRTEWEKTAVTTSPKTEDLLKMQGRRSHAPCSAKKRQASFLISHVRSISIFTLCIGGSVWLPQPPKEDTEVSELKGGDCRPHEVSMMVDAIVLIPVVCVRAFKPSSSTREATNTQEGASLAPRNSANKTRSVFPIARACEWSPISHGHQNIYCSLISAYLRIFLESFRAQKNFRQLFGQPPRLFSAQQTVGFPIRAGFSGSNGSEYANLFFQVISTLNSSPAREETASESQSRNGKAPRCGLSRK